MDKKRDSKKSPPQRRPERDQDVRKEHPEQPSESGRQPAQRDRDMDTPMPGSWGPEEDEE